MKKSVTKLVLMTALPTFLMAGVNFAHAQDPLQYPPFSWPSDKPEKPVPREKKASPKTGKTDIYQSRDASKQWVDGDFLGMDDD